MPRVNGHCYLYLEIEIQNQLATLDALYFYVYAVAVDPVQRAILILQEAEGGLRRVMEEEIASGRYSNLPTLASLADGVSGLVRGIDGSTPSADAKPGATTPSPQCAQPTRNEDGHRGSSRKPIPVAPKSSAKKKAVKKKAKYPYFDIADGWIGKVGWSKKNREEYRHYAPTTTALALAEHIDRTQGAGRVWTVESLGNVADEDSGEALPSYQLYLVIAWMRSAELLSKQGRSGYVAVGGGRLKPGVEKALAAHRE